MKKKNGFTLIELLAVIIILGVLMIIAVPAVTKYINDSRKNGYVSTAKEIAGSARNLVYSGSLDLDDKNTTYYVDGECLKTENDYRSPFGKFEKAYVAVTATDNDHEYYWFSVDETGIGVRNLISAEKLEIDNIEEGIDKNEITPNIGIDKRKNIVIYSGKECTKSIGELGKNMNSTSGRIGDACPEITPTIYWALKDTNSDNTADKLIISSSEVSGDMTGSFSSNTIFASESAVPWYNSFSSYCTGLNVEIATPIAPGSTAYWFANLKSQDESYSLDLSNLNVCNVTNMSHMFNYSGFSSFSFDVSNWDTSSVTNMDKIFEYAGANSYTSTVNLDLSSWDVSNVTSMTNAFTSFGYSASEVNLNLSGWNTSKVTNMSDVFFQMCELSNTCNVNLSNMNVSNVTNMSNMFCMAGQRPTSFNLNLNNWNVSKVTNMDNMFFSAAQRATNFTLNIGNWKTSSLTSADYMFSQVAEYSATASLDLRNWDVTHLTSLNNMFSYFGYSGGAISLNLSNWNTSNVTSMNETFQNVAGYARSLNLDISNWNMSNVTNMTSILRLTCSFADPCNIIIPKTNDNGINNTTSKIYGKTTDVYDTPYNGKSFTLAS